MVRGKHQPTTTTPRRTDHEMTTTNRRAAALTSAIGLATIVALSGCSAGATVRAVPDATAAATVTPTTEASSASSPAPAHGEPAGAGPATSGGTAAAADGECDPADLSGSLIVRAGGGSAGHEEYDIVLRNIGSSPCTLQGWPGVSFVGKGNGTQLGAPATFDRSSAHGTVTIASGGVAHASVMVADASAFGDCHVVTADGFRVYPPGSKASLFVADGTLNLSACTNLSTAQLQLQVQAMQSGS